MRMAHLIMVHKNIKQVERLVTKLYHQDFDFYIHVDKKINIEEFEYLSTLKNVYLIKERKKINWAAYSFTKNILRCVREVLESGDYDHVNLMSGQDYHLKSPQAIYDFFNNNIGKSFVSYDEDLNSAWWKLAKDRIEKYHFTDFEFKGRHKLGYLINLILPKRTFPLPFVLYGGECSTWWTLSAASAKYLVDFVNDDHRLQRFLQFTWCPDEFLITTILMNYPGKNLVVNNNYRYIDWSQGGANPKTLTKDNFEELSKSNMLFARKFDIDVDEEIMDMLDDLKTDSTNKL
jgi:hypothetical protein